jgi:bacterioferritin (cytochrome b1)
MEYSTMANEQLLAALNEVLAMEYGAVIQYAQHHFLVRGHDRILFGNFFDANSKEAHLHALNLGNKIMALGGTPTIEHTPVQQASQLHEMLLQDLAMERRALAAYTKAWELAEGHQSLRFWLEDIIRLEQLHVEELERLTDEQVAKSNALP